MADFGCDDEERDRLMTVNDLLTARGFWGPRRESPDQVADRLVAFLAALDGVAGEALAWSSPDLPGKLLAEPANALQVISDAFRENTDAPQLGINQVYEARGNRVSKVRVSMTVGGYSDSPKLRNAFLVRWRGAELDADPVVQQLVAA